MTINEVIDNQNSKTLDITHFQERPKNRVEYLSLDPSYLDTSVVREIGITGQTSYVEEEVKD